MADSTQINFVHHVESYVDSGSPSQQDASLLALAKLVTNDIITLESLVREMEMYLTTTDNIIRARGILLLAELLTRISSKRLESNTVHSLIGFFADRLSDWRALRGALVGCLALMRRKSDIGAITGSDANAVAQSFMQNLQVQSLGQHDRKLCFEVLECLIDSYPDTLLSMEDEFVYVICEAIDGEKDPQCLLLTFHLVERLAQMYPESSSSLASYAEDLFNILGSYFPIHFTHPKGEDEVKREELSRALMLAFASTPLFEPFAIPLLLEKLSSSLPSSKIESLKYLNYCMDKYSGNGIQEQHEALWSSLKDIILTSAPSLLTFGPGHLENKVADEALVVVQKLIQKDHDSVLFLKLILKDVDVNTTLNNLSSYSNYDDITVTDKQRLNAVSRILHVSAAASVASCTAIFQSFFSALVTGLQSASDGPKFGYLYVCVDLLTACRTLIKPAEIIDLDKETWCTMLYNFCPLLTCSFVKTMKESTHDIAVTGLKILASFPGSFLPVSKSTFEEILVEFTSIIVFKFNNVSIWRPVLDALVEIGSLIEKSDYFEKMASFDIIVVERMLTLLSSDDLSMPFSLKVEAVSKIGMTNLKYMLKIVQEFNTAISTNLQKYWLDGNSNSAEHAMLLLECYVDKVLPWFQNIKDTNNVPTQFALKVWSEIEHYTRFCDSLNEKVSVLYKKLLETTMNGMKHAVASCSEDSQSMILDKAFSVLSSSTSFQVNGSTQPVDFSCRDEWVISLFDSVIIALHPKTQVKNTKEMLHNIMRALSNGHIPSAHALGSLFNKMQYFSLEEAMDITFNKYIMGNSRLSNDIIIGLAWVGKGLLMRGHEIVKDIIKFLLNFLISNESISLFEDREDLMRAVADSFSIIMSDSEASLNKKFHATVKPLYKQRLFNMVMPILLSSIVQSDSSTRYKAVVHRALAHVISNTPLSAILGEANKLIALMVDGLTILSEDVENRDIVYNLLLVLSGILTDKNGQEIIVENAYMVIMCLNKLIFYQHMMLVRETAVQCLTAMSELPYSRVYRFRPEVLQALSRALDDPKRSVRQEAVRCRHAW
ncbi:MMS19 nucleotide excision repair protein homolog [Bidens hawaiensis]|uniref:MMS19 nucleotide excision repair protein homolog n=1 Tax=Bidens hawaiensis TaxID=980011 RepID=UPI00404B0E18